MFCRHGTFFPGICITIAPGDNTTIRQHEVLQNLLCLKVRTELDTCEDLEKIGEGQEIKSRPCYFAKIIKYRMYISWVTCENVAKSWNLACPYMRGFGWPHQVSVCLSNYSWGKHSHTFAQNRLTFSVYMAKNVFWKFLMANSLNRLHSFWPQKSVIL